MKCEKDFRSSMEDCELARAYICPQKFKRIYKVDKALKEGPYFQIYIGHMNLAINKRLYLYLEEIV